MKRLKKWNVSDGTHTYYVAAYSQRQAVELLNAVCRFRWSVSDIREYATPLWGVPASSCIDEPEVPGVWMQYRDAYWKFEGSWSHRTHAATKLPCATAVS